MSLLDAPGDVAATPVAALLLDALNTAATGVLTVRHGGAESRVFLQDGVPVGAQTFAAFKPLGQVLLAQRRIDMDALARSLAEMARTGRPQGDVLVEMGAVTRADVDQALSEQQAGYLALVAALDAGSFSFEARPVPEWTRGIRIAPLRAIVDALARPQAAPLVASALDPAQAPIAVAPGYDRLAEAFGWSAEERALVAGLARGADAAARAHPGIPAPRARAIAAALLLLGLASREGSPEVMPTDAVKEVARLAGEPLELELTPVEDDAPAAPAAPPPPRDPAADAAGRERRQRLLARTMQNLGVGPAARPAGAPGEGGPTGPHAAPAATTAGAREEVALRAAVAELLPRVRNPDLFARLGLSRSATRDEVKQAYFQLARRFHPDRFGAASLADVRRAVGDLFAALNEAYDVLSDDRRRTAWMASSAGEAPVSPEAAAQAAIDFAKGEACVRTRDRARARAFYEAAVRGDPRPDHLAALAQLLLDDPGADRARVRQLAADALRDGASARAAYVAALVAREDHDDAVTERHLRAALALEPRHADALRELRALEARKVRRERPRD